MGEIDKKALDSYLTRSPYDDMPDIETEEDLKQVIKQTILLYSMSTNFSKTMSIDSLTDKIIDVARAYFQDS